LIAIHLGLFGGNKEYLLHFLDCFEWNNKYNNINYTTTKFSYYATCYSILHEFNVFEDFQDMLADFTEPKQLETLFWSFSK